MIGRLKQSSPKKIERLVIAATQKQFASQRAMSQYIGVNSRPDICQRVQLIYPGNYFTNPNEFKVLEKIIKHFRTTPNQGLNFVQLKFSTISLILLTDASFENAKNLRSQLGFVILLVDGNYNANVLYYGSQRCRRVTSSIMESELHALILGFDYSLIVRSIFEDILGRAVSLDSYLDIKTVYDFVAKDGSTTEKIFQIDVFSLRESYARE